MREMNAAGITSIQDASGGLGSDWRESTAIYRTMEGRGQLTLRARVAFPLFFDRTMTALRKELDELRDFSIASGAGMSLTTFGILKGFADGVIENRTAALLRPYADASAIGQLTAEADAIKAAIFEADRRGWQVEVHAIGDRAVRVALDAFEASSGFRGGHRRHRLEHIESIDSDDVPRFGSLGVVASMQPLHALPDDDLGAVWQLRAGPQRSSRGWAWESIRRAGGILAFGSDWPVVTFDPQVGMYVALTRERPGAGPAGGWIPTERMNLRDVIRAYTHGAACAELSDDRRGRIDVGMDADLVVWDRDLEAVDQHGVLEARPVFTVLAGRLVYDGTSGAASDA
jgi:predicted amidohydrolase YtcJ